MRKLVIRALKSMDKLGSERLHVLVRELINENERLEMVLSSIPGAVLVTDPEHRVIMVNKPARRLFLIGEECLNAQFVWEFFESPELSNYIREALVGDKGASMQDFPYVRQDINLIIGCGVLPLIDNKSIVGNMVYIEDLTENRNQQAHFKRMEGLASLTTMAAGVAHEIKNPLASMGIHLQVMKRHLNSAHLDSAELSECVKVVEEETERLNSIVSDYLFAVRPSNSNPEMSNLNQLINELVQFLRFEMEASHVGLILNLDKDLPQIPLDVGSMKRAMLNLIKNALAAMDGGGDLELHTYKDYDHVYLKIIDSGEGIPEELAGKVFEPYFTTRDSGSGLGLTIVYKVVRDHGGDLKINSAPGKGTAVLITLSIPQREQKLLEDLQ